MNFEEPQRRNDLCKILGLAIGATSLMMLVGGAVFEVRSGIPFLSSRPGNALLGLLAIAYGLWIRSFASEVTRWQDRIMNARIGKMNLFGFPFPRVSYDTEVRRATARIGGAFAVLVGTGLLVVATIRK